MSEQPLVAGLSYFFPAHNEEATTERLVANALETLPSLAETFDPVVGIRLKQIRADRTRALGRGTSILDERG